MGTLTYTQLTTEVLANLGNRTLFDSARLLNLMNIMQQRLARKPKWKELKSTVESTFVITASATIDKFLTVPANTRDILTFRVITTDGDSRKLRRRTTRQFDNLIPEPEYYARGTPEMYTEFDDKLEFWRVPDEAETYLIRRTTWPTPFTGLGTQTSDFTHKDDLLIALASSWALHSIGRLEDAARWFTVFKDMFMNAKLENDDEPDEEMVSGSQVVSGVDSSYWLDPFHRGV